MADDDHAASCPEWTRVRPRRVEPGSNPARFRRSARLPTRRIFPTRQGRRQMGSEPACRHRCSITTSRSAHSLSMNSTQRVGQGHRPSRRQQPRVGSNRPPGSSPARTRRIAVFGRGTISIPRPATGAPCNCSAATWSSPSIAKRSMPHSPRPGRAAKHRRLRSRPTGTPNAFIKIYGTFERTVFDHDADGPRKAENVVLFPYPARFLEIAVTFHIRKPGQDSYARAVRDPATLTAAGADWRTKSALLNVSYDPTRELYKAFNEAFAKFTGKRSRDRKSRSGSRTPARAHRRDR